MTWIDWAIVSVVLFAALHGLRRGIIAAFLGAVGVIIAYLAASIWYRPLASLISEGTRLVPAWANTVAYGALLVSVYVLIGTVAAIIADSYGLAPSVCLVSSPVPRRARCCRPRCWGCCWPRRSAGGLRTMPGNRRWRRWHCGCSKGAPSRWRGSSRTAFTHLGLRRCASNRELKSWKVEELECLVSPTLQLFNSSTARWER